MARDLEADLKLCDAANRIGKFSSTGMSQTTVQLATGWAETIRELMEARKRIAELESRLAVLTPCETCDGKGWVYDTENGGTMCCPECD